MVLVLVLKVTNTKCSILEGQVCQNSRFGIGLLASVNAFGVTWVYTAPCLSQLWAKLG